MAFIELKDVCYSYKTRTGDIKALDNFSLSVETGSFVSVIGSNGCGKSTLAKVINALIIPDSGNVSINGMDSSCSSNVFDIRRTVGLVFQEPDYQIVSDIVESDVAFGPENLGLDSSEINKRVTEALKTVKAENLRFSETSLLSGGEKQRVAIAGVLALGCSCIVIDESASMIDPPGHRDIMKYIHKLNRENKITVINITHNVQDCCNSNAVVVMDKGKNVFTGTPESVFSNSGLLESLELEIPVVARVSQSLGIGTFVTSKSLIDKLKERF